MHISSINSIKQLDTLYTNNSTNERQFTAMHTYRDTARTHLNFSQTVAVPWSYYHIERAVHKTNCTKGSHWKPLADKVFLKLHFPLAIGASHAFQCLVYEVEFIAHGCSLNHSTHPCPLTLWGSGKDLKHGTMSMWTQRNTHSHALTFDETYYSANKTSDSLSTCCTIVQNYTHINTRHKHEVSEDCARIFFLHKTLNILSNVKTNWFMIWEFTDAVYIFLKWHLRKTS